MHGQQAKLLGALLMEEVILSPFNDCFDVDFGLEY